MTLLPRRPVGGVPENIIEPKWLDLIWGYLIGTRLTIYINNK